ncbi:iron-containing alcohol dehydrogenase [Methylobacterium oxalidis]|uniref:iron-containing alcohol dehydrogenase n=1 Tax=Methylobacterium oxalidis TaxID=944322 RepID=UPI003314AA96
MTEVCGVDVGPIASGRPFPVRGDGRHETLPQRLVTWGIGSAARLRPEIEAVVGRRQAILLTTASLAREERLLLRVQDALGGILLDTIDALAAHVPANAVRVVAERVYRSGADLLVAFGGGSVLDAAKAASSLCARGRDRETLPIVALPTTLSGSEFSHYYGVTDWDGEHLVKRGFAEPSVTPAVVVLDPELTQATPSRLWTSSGIKALDHAIEGLLSPGSSPATAPVLLDGIRRMAAVLPGTCDPEALDVRLEAQIAAWLCFVAPATVRFGLSHRIGHILGGTFGVPHSLTSCATLAPVLRSHAGDESPVLSEIAAALGTAPSAAGSGIHPAAGLAADRLLRLVRDLGLPTRLRDLSLDQDSLAVIGKLLLEHYPNDARRLGQDHERQLADLLRAMW